MTGPSEPNLSGGDADPFSHLHKMSTTAGLGSGDYVAISGTAIAAILLGVGSSLVLFNNLVFLIIPVVGIVAAVVALVQIAHSNGTQTGRGVAAIGLLLSLGFGGYFSGKTIYDDLRNRADEAQIISNAHQLGDLLKTEKYADAYNLLDDQMRRRLSLSQFESGWQRMSASPIIGSIKSLDWNKVLLFDVDPVDGTRVASGMMLLYAQPAEPLRLSMSFRQQGGNWLIDQIPQMFPADAAQSSGGNSSGARSKGSDFIGPIKQ